jgi:hypothetical protein
MLFKKSLEQLDQLEEEDLIFELVELLDVEDGDWVYFLDVLRACIDRPCLEKTLADLALEKLENIRSEISVQIEILVANVIQDSFYSED